MPCAKKNEGGLVLVWTFGTWMVHCVDPKVFQDLILFTYMVIH